MHRNRARVFRCWYYDRNGLRREAPEAAGGRQKRQKRQRERIDAFTYKGDWVLVHLV